MNEIFCYDAFWCFPVLLLCVSSHFPQQIVADAGHSANEPGTAAELVAANEKIKNSIKNKGLWEVLPGTDYLSWLSEWEQK